MSCAAAPTGELRLLPIILIFAVVIWYITKSDSDADKAGKGMQLVKDFGDMFKKQ